MKASGYGGCYFLALDVHFIILFSIDYIFNIFFGLHCILHNTKTVIHQPR